ncbi:MAG: glycosyltransferase family 4 protein [Planctomycetales bacterium]|nr:glycosyltransferase family 4 protein [Planctomycetales bacterium]
MKIAYLTAGAAGMYCGSCMHDNTLAAALCRQGADAVLVPTYTPIRTDENDVSLDQVFFGGINIYLQQKIPFFRYLPRFVDYFLDSPRLIRRVTRRAVSMSPKELGALTVSMLKGRGGYQRKEVGRLCDWLASDLRPDLVLLTNALIGGAIPEIKRRLGIPIVVTLQGDDIFLESLPEPYRQQSLDLIRGLAQDVDLFLTHSQFYADAMSQYLGIDRARMEVVPLGIDMGDFTSRDDEPRPSGAEPVVGYLARLAPEKGFGLLVDGFIEMARRAPDLPGRLEVAGWLGPTQTEFAEAQFEKIRAAGLEHRFRYVGSPDRHAKVDFLRSLDVLCVPTTYEEPKGLFALEALATGVPVILPRHGAFPEMLAETGGGWLIEPHAPTAVADALEQALRDPSKLSELGREGQLQTRVKRDSAAMAQAHLATLRRLMSESANS